MAIAFTAITSLVDSDGGATAATPSFTPASNKLYLIAVSSRTAITANPNIPTLTGNGLTWNTAGSIVFDSTSSSRKRVSLFWALGASPTAGAVSIDFASQANTHVCVTVDEVSGIDTTSPIVQTVTNKDEAQASTTLTATLAAFGSANNATYGVFTSDSANATPTAGTGFTLLNYADATSTLRLDTEYQLANDTTATFTWATNTGAAVGGVAIEIKAAASSGITADASITQAGNTITSAATIAIAASSSITQVGDTLSAASTIAIASAASITQASDSLTSATVIAIAANSSTTAASDTLSAATTVAINIESSTTLAGDTLIADSTITQASGGITADASITQADNTIVATAALAIAASATLTQAGDTCAGIASIEIIASASITQADNTLSSANSLDIRFDLIFSQIGDTLEADFTQAVEIFADADLTQNDNTLFSETRLTITAIANITQQNNDVPPLSLFNLLLAQNDNHLVSSARFGMIANKTLAGLTKNSTLGILTKHVTTSTLTQH